MNHGTHEVTWHDSGKSPSQPPNPKFPNGVDFPPRYPGSMFCKVDLPYPAKRIGNYLIVCRTCRFRITLTTAGRPDDPRSVAMNCKIIPS